MELLNNIKSYVFVVYIIFISVLIFGIILENKKPEKSYAYIFLILLFPVGGVLIYFLLGAQYQKKRLYARKRMYNKEYLKALNKASRQNSKILAFEEYKKLPTLFYNLEQVDFTRENSVKFLLNGEEKFPVLLEELRKAEKTIHLIYYIFNDDEIGSKVIDILCEKAKKGVKVRLVYDDVGSSISKKTSKKLKEASVEAYAYMPVLFSRLAHKANYRNHRKIAIIDNKVGFLGGINISDTYINSNDKKVFWRDTHLLLKGQAVIDLQYEFLSDWYFVSGQEIAYKEFQYSKNIEIVRDIPTCILGSDFGSDFQNIMEAFFGLITSAKKEILITTPYFLPNESILNAIKITAKSGVKIKLMIPKKTDIKTAYYASQTYYEALLESGVEIYYYTKGMIHAKTMVIDTYICTIGSTNMDYRSFNLNAEINAFIVDKQIAKELKSHFEMDLKDAYQLRLEELKKRKWHVKVMCSVARLIAPVL